MRQFAYIWEYRVRPEAVTRFQEIYGPDGDWVHLFERAHGYARTELYRDVKDPLRFVTTDYWSSRNAWNAFRAQHAEAFEKLDKDCEDLTSDERFIGDFEVAS